MLLLCFAVNATSSFAQIEIPAVNWNIEASKLDVKEGDIVTLTFTANVPEGSYIYSTNIDCKIGPIKPSLTLKNSEALELIGSLQSEGDKKEFDDIFDCNIGKFTKKVILKQKVKVLNVSDTAMLLIEAQMCSAKSGICTMTSKSFKLAFKQKKASKYIKRGGGKHSSFTTYYASTGLMQISFFAIKEERNLKIESSYDE